MNAVAFKANLNLAVTALITNFMQLQNHYGTMEGGHCK